MSRNSTPTEGYDVTTFEFPSQKKEGKGGWEPSFASNLILNFRVLIRPYWPGQANSLIKGIELDLCYQNQNVRGRKALNRGQSLILCTVRNNSESRHATLAITLGVEGYRLNRLDEPFFMAGAKPMQTEFGIHNRMESCVRSYLAIGQ